MIDRVADLSREQFLVDYQSRGRPLILTQGLPQDGLWQRWSLDYLAATHSSHVVQVEHYPDGDQGGSFLRRSLRFDQYVQKIRDPRTRHHFYLAETQLEDTFPNCAGDLRRPAVLDGCRILETAIFAGADSFTPAHYHRAGMEALLTQISGLKRVVLFAAREYRHLRPNAWYALRSNFSRIDVSGSPDPLATYRDLPNVTPHECVLRPGEALFIPQGWFHAVAGIGESISVTYFFEGRWRHAHPALGFRDFFRRIEELALLAPAAKLATALKQEQPFYRLLRTAGILDKRAYDHWERTRVARCAVTNAVRDPPR